MPPPSRTRWMRPWPRFGPRRQLPRHLLRVRSGRPPVLLQPASRGDRAAWMALPWPLIGLGLLAVLVLWGLTRGDADEMPDSGSVGAASTAPDARAAPAAPAESERQAGATAARTPARQGSEAEGAIMAAVADANRAWVEGDLERHIGHYGRRVDYYNSKRLARSGVLRDRRRDLKRYPEREITIARQVVQFPEPRRARVLADKSWRFGGGERERSGKGLQEYVLEQRDDGRWVIVGEQLLEEFRTERRTETPED